MKLSCKQVHDCPVYHIALQTLDMKYEHGMVLGDDSEWMLTYQRRG